MFNCYYRECTKGEISGIGVDDGGMGIRAVEVRRWDKKVTGYGAEGETWDGLRKKEAGKSRGSG